VALVELLPILFLGGKGARFWRIGSTLWDASYSGGKLMIASPWFSIETRQDSEKSAVHHNNTSCKAGKQIPKNHHRYGTDNRLLCKQCARLDAEGR